MANRDANDRLLEERRKYAEEMARKFYKNHKKEPTPSAPAPIATPSKESSHRGRSASLSDSKDQGQGGETLWKVLGDTQQGAKKLYDSMSGLGKGMAYNPGSVKQLEPEKEGEIQMESVEEAGESSDNLRKSAPATTGQPTNGRSSNSGNPPVKESKTGEAERTETKAGGAEIDETLLKVGNVSNEQFMYALKKRLKRAQKTERELEELRKKYLEASVTSEQLVIMLGKEKQTVEQLKDEIKQLTKHNVRLVEILGHVKATTDGGPPSPRHGQKGAKEPAPGKKGGGRW